MHKDVLDATPEDQPGKEKLVAEIKERAKGEYFAARILCILILLRANWLPHVAFGATCFLLDTRIVIGAVGGKVYPAADALYR